MQIEQYILTMQMSMLKTHIIICDLFFQKFAFVDFHAFSSVWLTNPPFPPHFGIRDATGWNT